MNRLKARMIASLTLVILACSGPAPTAQAGPISDMLARHRQNQQMKLPPVDKPFSTKPVRDLNARNQSLTQRFKQRFHLNRSGTAGMSTDSGLIKTSR
jgi:hypothetical protein